MEKQNLKEIVKNLKSLVNVLESEVYSDVDAYSNSKALDKYNEIFNSSLISASTKERVKKIHEFELYK